MTFELFLVIAIFAAVVVGGYRWISSKNVPEAPEVTPEGPAPGGAGRGRGNGTEEQSR